MTSFKHIWKITVSRVFLIQVVVLPGNEGKEVVRLERVGLFLSPVSGEAAVQGPAKVV